MMTSDRVMPWDALGTPVREVTDLTTALRLANLDWSVEKRQLQFPTAVGPVPVSNRFAVIRTDTLDVLGIVAARYVPRSNVQAFDFVNQLTVDDVRIHAAGSHRSSKVVFLVLQMTRTLQVQSDVHDVYIVARTSHDGSRAGQVYVVPVRKWGGNITGFTVYKQPSQKWSSQHVSVNAELNILENVRRYLVAFESAAVQLMRTRITAAETHALIPRIIPKRARATQTVEQMMDILENSSYITDEHRETCWGVLNAIIEYYDWAQPRRSAAAHFVSVLDGQGAIVRNRSVALLLARGA